MKMNSIKKNRRGFIGPISDDLPSLIAILLALSMFFSALAFALNEYNAKVSAFNKIKGTMEIGRAITSKGLLDATDSSNSLAMDVKEVAESYGLSYCITLGNTFCIGSSSSRTCKPNWVHYVYLISQQTSSGIQMRRLEICGGEG
jgi:hypothetical protein